MDPGNSLNSLISLNNIKLDIKKGKFICVISECGTCKGSLLNAVIGDLAYVHADVIGKYGLERKIEEKQRKEVAREMIKGVGKGVKVEVMWR